MTRGSDRSDLQQLWYAVGRLDGQAHISERCRNQYQNKERCEFGHEEPPSEWVARKRGRSLKVPDRAEVKASPSPVRDVPARLPDAHGIPGWRGYHCSFRLLEWSSPRATWPQNASSAPLRTTSRETRRSLQHRLPLHGCRSRAWTQIPPRAQNPKPDA